MTGRSTRRQLTDRLRTVWPEPIEIALTRRPRRSADAGEEYLVLPTMSRPVLLVPAASSSAAGALARSDDGQRSPVLSRALQGAHRRGILRRVPGIARVAVPDTEGLVATVRRLVPEADAVVVRLGRRRHGRAVVLQALDAGGRSLAFAKCARGAGVDRLRAERDRLHELADRPVPGITPPPVLGWAVEDGAAVLCIGALLPGARPASGDVPIAAMHALAARSGLRAEQPLAESLLVRRLSREAAALAQVTPDAGWIVEHLHRLVATHGDLTVTGAAWHGDWVPWNMVRDGEDVLLWDWEHYEDDVVVGFDHVHYLAQTRRLRDGTDSAAEDAWLVDAHRALTTDWSLTEPQAEATIGCYLAAINLRFLTDRLDDPAGPTDRQGWARPLVERLAGNPA
jgi:hypothetical protein